MRYPRQIHLMKEMNVMRNELRGRIQADASNVHERDNEETYNKSTNGILHLHRT